jgi:hypothetical protein
VFIKNLPQNIINSLKLFQCPVNEIIDKQKEFATFPAFILFLFKRNDKMIKLKIKMEEE